MLKKPSIVPALIFAIILFGGWEILVQINIINESLVPSPSMIFKNALIDRHEFALAFSESLQNAALGFVLSAFLGVMIAFVFSLYSSLKKALLPWAVFFQTVPIIAIAPLLVIYFGYGSPTVIASSFIVSLFPILANTLSGLQRYPREQEQLFDLYGASAGQKLIKLKLPHALPSIFAGLKITAGLSIVGAVAGEFVAGGGLGAIIDAGRTQQRVDRVFAALLLLAFMGGLLIGLIGLLARILNKRRPYGVE